MTFSSALSGYRIATTLMALMLATSSGCTTLNLGTFSLDKGSGKYVGVEPGLVSQAGNTAEVYQKVREARSQNAIVLQLPDDEDSPIRVLPLPPGEQSVFVSDLLTQTGVLKKLGRVDAVVFRHSNDSISGIRMAVKMTPGGNNVRPESDYALRPGDRLAVQKSENTPISGLFSAVLGL